MRFTQRNGGGGGGGELRVGLTSASPFTTLEIVLF